MNCQLFYVCMYKPKTRPSVCLSFCHVQCYPYELPQSTLDVLCTITTEPNSSLYTLCTRLPQLLRAHTLTSVLASHAAVIVWDHSHSLYISRLCYNVSVHLSVTEVHWRFIANLGFKFRSQFTTHCGHSACGREGRDHRREEWRNHLAPC